MKLRSHITVAFAVLAITAGYIAYATAGMPPKRAVKPSIPQAYVLDSNMHVVVIKGKRLTAAEKAAPG